MAHYNIVLLTYLLAEKQLITLQGILPVEVSLELFSAGLGHII